MQFKVGDFVVHPVHGMGDIVKIEEKRFSGIGARLYYEVALSRSTIWIPVEAQETVGLRLVTVKSDLDQYRDVLKSPPVPLKKDQPRQRHLELARRSNQGSFQMMCEIVRDLTASGWQKTLGATDKATLQKTRERLYQEWATAADISIVEAIKEIDSLLLTARSAETG